MSDNAGFYESQALVIKSLAHPARLIIVDRLRNRSVCVRELTKAVGCDISTVSQHLAVLRRAGIVASEKKANKVFYSLKCPCALDFLGCIMRIVKTNARRQSKILAGAARNSRGRGNV